MKCPNKNSNEWLLLESYFGEIESYRIWISNNEELPSIEEIEALKKGEDNSLVHRANLSKGINRLKDSNGKAMPHKNVTAFVDTLTWAVFNIRESLLKDGEGGKPKKIIDILQKDLQKHLENYEYFAEEDADIEDIEEGNAFPTKEENKLVAEYYKHILDSFDEYIDLVTTKINTMGYSFKMNSSITELQEESIDNSSLQEDVDDEFVDEIETETKNNYKDGGTFLENPYDKLSAEIKKMVSMIPNNEPNILGKTSFVNQQVVYSALLDIFANKEISFEEGIKELEKNVVVKPYLQELINMMKNGIPTVNAEGKLIYKPLEEHTKIRFNSQFKNNYLTHTTQKIEVKEKNNLKELVIKWLENNKDAYTGTIKDQNIKFKDPVLNKQWSKTTTFNKNQTKIFLDLIGVDYTTIVVKNFNSNRNNQAQVLLEEWLSESINAPIFKRNTDGSATVKNTEFIKEVFTPQWNKIKESNYDTIEVQAFLDLIGFNIDIEVLDYLKSNSKNELEMGWEPLFTSTNGNGTFNVIYNSIINLKEDLDIETDNPLGTEKQVKNLIKVVLKFKPTTITENFTNVELKSTFAYVNPTWFVNRYHRLIENKDKLREKLLSLPVNSFSYYLTMLKASKTFRDVFNVEVLDGLSKDDFALKFNKMSNREKLINQINFFINSQQGKEGKDEKYSKFLTPSKADKTTLHILNAVRYNVKSNSTNFTNKTFNDNDKQILLNLVRGEFARIKDAQKKEKEGVNFKDINGYKPDMFYNYPKLNDIKELWVGGELIDFEDAEDIVWNVVKEDTYSQIEDLRTELNKLSILKLKALHSDYFKEHDLEYFLADYIINYNVFRVNYDILFNGDPATAFKTDIKGTQDNVFKRLTGDIAPARRCAKLESNKHFQKYNQIFMEDAFNGSLNLEQLKKLFGNEDRVIKAYSQIEGTDAQELTTLEEHLNVMYYSGKIETSTYKKLITEARKKEPFFSKEELDIILQPMKPVYVGNKFMTEYNVDLPVYIKSSSFPLIPQLVEKTEFAMLEKQMRKHNIQRATFATGAKRGAFKTIDVWNKQKDKDGNIVTVTIKGKEKALTDGTFNEEVINESIKNGAFLQLDRDNFGIQQETPYDADKASILEGSQLSKLILNGLRGNKEIIDKFNELHNNIIESSYQEFLNEIGATENEDGSYNFTDITKFAELLEKELKARGGYTENDLLALTLNDSKTDFKIPIWSNPKSNQFEALLNSIINKRIIRQKIAGKSYILGTEEGFKGSSPEIYYIKEEQLTGTKYDKNTGLKPQRYGYVKNGRKLEESDYLKEENKDGWNKVVFPAQIFVARGKYKGKQMVGYRIPTQDLNSMSAMEVVGYLPEYMGDLLIASKDFTKQMGSDFDIDKIYVHRWYEGKNGKRYNIESIEAEWEVITNQSITKASEPIRVAETLANKFSSLEDFRYTEDEVQEVIDFVLSKYPTQEEYIEKRKIKILKNEIVDIYWNTLIDLNNLKSILKPLDEGNLKNIVKVELEKIEKAKNNTQRHHLSPLYQLDNYENGTAGKVGVSMTSLASTFNALLLASPTDININLYDENKELIKFAFKINGDIVEVTSLNQSDMTLDGKSKKADTISAVQSISVDNIKELIIKLIKYNKNTHDAFVTLALFGLNDEYISYFLAQPAIKQYVTELQTLGDSFSEDPKSRFSEAATIIFDKLIQEENELAEKELREPRNINSASFKWNKAYSKEELLTEIGKEDPFTQAILLHKFLLLSSVGKEINTVIRAIQPGTSGVGKDRAIANNKELMFEEAFRSETITGLQGLIINTVAGKGIEVLKRSNSLYNRFFKINTVVRKLIDQVNLNRNWATKALTEKEQKQFINFSKSYIFSSALNMYYGRNVQEYRKDLLFGNNTLADKWSVFKKENPDNWLAQRINIIPTNNINKPKFITYRASVKDETSDVRNVSELIEMLESDDLSTRELAEDTIAYTYLTGGTQNAISLLKFIPIEYLNYTRFGEHVHHSLNNVNPVALLEQFLKHYPYYATKVDSTFREEDGLLKSDKNKGTYVADQINYKWKLYKKIDANEVGFVYKPTDTLGTFGSSETNFNTINTESVFESNQTIKKEVEQKSLPAVEEHIDSSKVEVINIPIVDKNERLNKALITAREFYLEDWLNKNPRYFLDLPIETNSDEAENEYERAISESRELTRITSKNYKKALFHDKNLGDWISNNPIAGKGQSESIWSEKTHGIDIIVSETSQMTTEINVKDFNTLINQYKKGDYDENQNEKERIEKFIKLHGLWKSAIEDPNQLKLDLFKEVIGKQELKGNEELDEPFDEPLEQLRDEDYLNKQDKDLKKKYFANSNVNTIENVLTKISQSKHPLNTLAKQLIKYAKISNVTIELVNDADSRLTGRAAAHYNRKTNSILLKQGVSFKGLGSEPTILHEIIHALTVKEMVNNPNSELVKEIDRLFEHASKHIPNTVYGMKNKFEFVAELFTNAGFINRLKDIPATESNKYKNFLQEFFDKVLNLLGINRSNTLYEQAFALSTNIIESQYEKFKLEQESLSVSDFDNSFDSPIFDEYTDEEITELIKRCK